MSAVLVIDDEEELAQVIEYALARQHQVVVATQAKRGLDLLLGEKEFDVVFCDLMMPEISGMELHRQLGEKKPHLLDRIVFMSGGAFTAEARRFVAGLPKNRMIEKPFRLQAIREVAAQFSQKIETKPRS